MIKVLILGLHGILGGSETYINNLIRCFDSEEIKCDFLVVGDDKTPYEDSINIFYNDGYNHFFYCPDLKKNFSEGNKWLKNFYDTRRYDLIYLNATSAANAIYCKYAISKQKCPLITHSHFSNGPWLNHVLFRFYTVKHSMRKLACAEPAAKWMFGKNTEEVIFIPNGIDTDRFRYNFDFRQSVRSMYGIGEDKIVLGHVGRFSTEKNHKFLIELCKKLPEQYLFLCVGEGPCKSPMLQLIQESNLSDRFIILPVDTEVEKYYSAMDVFVMPSLYEGLPIVSVEAQCSGLQVIFSDTISKQADLSGRCYFEQLNNEQAWAERILNLEIERYDGEECIRKSGFSIKDAAMKIELMIKQICKENKCG